MQTRRAIVQLLKTEGALDSISLGRRLKLTPMAVRQHLYALQDEKLVTSEERPVPRGRPAKFWTLTPDAARLFPDAYAELSVALLSAVEDTFGVNGVQRLIGARLTRQQSDYAARIPARLPLEKKLQRLAQLRTAEGYMAEVRREGKGVFVLVENHCPICAAATACQGFCASELELFRSILGPDVQVERVEHIVGGDRRCAYRVAALSAGNR
jgi:predicted ArsR family transcriptional regulator